MQVGNPAPDMSTDSSSLHFGSWCGLSGKKNFKNLPDIEKKLYCSGRKKQLDREEYIPLLEQILGKVDMEGIVDPKDHISWPTRY